MACCACATLGVCMVVVVGGGVCARMLYERVLASSARPQAACALHVHLLCQASASFNTHSPTCLPTLQYTSAAVEVGAMSQMHAAPVPMQMQKTTTSEAPSILGDFSEDEGEGGLRITPASCDGCVWLEYGSGQGPGGGGLPVTYCHVGNGRYCQFNYCMPYLIFLGGPTLVFEAPDTLYNGCCFCKCQKYVRVPEEPEPLPVATAEPLPVATAEPLPVATAEPLPVAAA